VKTSTILLDKLEFYGSKGKFLELIQPYLRDRFQKLLKIKIHTTEHPPGGKRW
jgi:hypothetical protein